MNISRLQTATVCVILFAGSWCLAQTKGNIFWLAFSVETYLTHLAVWAGMVAFLYSALSLAGGRSDETEDRLASFIIMASPLNLLDYGMRAVFGKAGDWSKGVLLLGTAVSLSLFVLAATLAMRGGISRATLRKLVGALMAPCLLLIYHALPGEFALERIVRPRREKSKPPVYVMVFDMLSYDFLMRGDGVSPAYPNFEAFSRDADVYLNARSPAGTTASVIPRLITRNDLAQTATSSLQWTAKTRGSSKSVRLSTLDTLFSLADEDGYDIFLRAFAIPYLNYFGDRVQDGEFHPFDSLWRIGMHSMIWPVLSPGGLRHQRTAALIARDLALRAARDPRGTLFYIHWNIPHHPFIYDADGKELGRIGLSRRQLSPPPRKRAYEHQLTGTDAVFGEVLRAMKDGGAYHESLVIVTSDHNIKGFDFDMKKVPLLIKRPGRNASRIVRSEAAIRGIVNYVDRFIKTGKCGEAPLRSGGSEDSAKQPS